ncbi:hypothetical protein BJ742DRAFT_788417 [Cladochytrium replicatum]|nr:hypothetical protein BJ742DRAFT_788417 [Cladochytrium replicatum]
MADAVLQTSTSHKLEPFLLLSKSARGAATVQLVLDALNAPGVYVFGELIETPSVDALKNDPSTLGVYTLLQLFAYGTYQDYLRERAAGNVPGLSPVQQKKLRYLSLVTLGGENRILDYSMLLEYLELANVRELEDLIIEAMYEDVVRGKLDQKRGCVEMEYAMGRDLRPDDIQQLANRLESWSNSTDGVLSSISAIVNMVQSRAADQKTQREEYEKAVETVKKDAKSGRSGGGGGGGGGYPYAMMDVDSDMRGYEEDRRRASRRMQGKRR